MWYQWREQVTERHLSPLTPPGLISTSTVIVGFLPSLSTKSTQRRKDMNSPPAAESEEHRSMWSREEGEQSASRCPRSAPLSLSPTVQLRTAVRAAGRRRGSCRLTGPSGSCFPSLILLILIIVTTAQPLILGSFIQHLRACNVVRKHLPTRFLSRRTF